MSRAERIFITLQVISCAILIALLITSCRAPDVVGIETGYADTSSSSPRPWLTGADGEAYWIGPYISWEIGAQTRHDETMRAMRRAEVEAARRTANPVPVVIRDEPKGTETEAPLDKILYAIAGILAAVGALIWVVVKRMGGKGGPKE